jgi:hypothetical protein
MMFDSGISVNAIVEELNTEVDIALDIPNKTYVQWLNALQQLLYTEVIKEQKRFVLVSPPPSTIGMDVIVTDNNENPPRFEDIYAVYADDVQLIKSTVTSGIIFPFTYYKDNNNIGYNTRIVDGVQVIPNEVTIVYIIKPALIDYNDIEKATVMMPIEFIDLVKAKLRGEAYKLANEDVLSAKWLNDYNILLENFKMWISEKASNFGI